MKADKEPNDRIRYNILTTIIYIIGIILLIQLFNLQIVHGEEYRETSNSRLTRESVVRAARGTIKDRTGIVSALILGLCNVDIKDIIANYEVTNTYVSNSEFMNTYSTNMKKSPPEFIKTFIDNLLDEYNSFEDYILSCKVSKENIEKIRNKFCEPIIL